MLNQTESLFANGGVVVRPLAFTSKVPISISSKMDLNPVLMCEEYSQRLAESRGFSPGTPVSSQRES